MGAGNAMTIRQGSKGTNDPAAAHWDRVFGGGAARAGVARGVASTGEPDSREPHPERPGHPSPIPAELDPDDGA